MGGQTGAPWLIPYPTGTDRVMDGDNAMQAIAERVSVISNALPRGLVARVTSSGALTPGGVFTLAGTLPTFTTTEARDFLLTLQLRGKTVTPATGVTMEVRRAGVAIASTVAIWATGAASSFDADLVNAQLAGAVPAGAQSWEVWVAGYGGTNNTLSSWAVNVLDQGASGAI